MYKTKLRFKGQISLDPLAIITKWEIVLEEKNENEELLPKILQRHLIQV